MIARAAARVGPRFWRYIATEGWVRAFCLRHCRHDTVVIVFHIVFILLFPRLARQESFTSKVRRPSNSQDNFGSPVCTTPFHDHISAELLFLEQVPTSILSTGQVGTNRDLLGSDGEFFGTDPLGLEVKIADGRGHRKTLDENGFCLMQHVCSLERTIYISV